MRAYLPAYEAVTATTLDEALRLLASTQEKWTPLAGGTDLMVLFDAGKLPTGKYLNINNIKEMHGIFVYPNKVVIGALTTYTEILNNNILQQEFPNMCQAARETGAIAIQNRGTIGGNIMNGSPAADTPPALLVYDAQLELVSPQGKRIVPYHGFHTGYKKTQAQPGELLYAVHLPRVTNGGIHYYRKVGTRRAQAISKVCFAGFAKPNGGQMVYRIALGSVAPIVIRCTQTEQTLHSSGGNLDAQVYETFTKEITPIDDIRSTKNYRLNVAKNLLLEFCEKLG